MVFNFLNKLPDKVENIEEGYDSELDETNVFKSIYSDRFDVVSYVYANQYIWRYPIITNPASAYFGTAEKDAKYLAKQDFVTFAIYDDTNSDNFTSDSSYQPTHENGNLFSYPAAVPNIEGYNERQKDLTEITGVQFGIPTSLGFTKIKANEHEETSSRTVTKGYLTKAFSLLDSIFNTSLANVPESKPESAFTKKTSNQEKFVLTLPNADGARLLGSYRIQTQAYIAEDGALTCGFAVNQFDQYASLFNSGSLYRQLPDPSFVLPRKFVLINSTPLIPEFGANSERETAMEMRGIRFYATDFNIYTTNRLLEGVKYRIEIPLYNASFQSASNVKVNLYWTEDRTENALADKHLIGTTTVNMTGWSDTGDNKAWAKFEFTPSDMAAYGRHYQLYAVIDPDGLIQEVHENRDLAKDSGGNNEGYFEFSVENVEPSNSLQDGLNDNYYNDDFELPDITYSGYASWEEFYDARIASSDGPVSLDVAFTNKSGHTLPNIELKVIYIDENSLSNRAVLGSAFTLFPYETYKIRALIDDDFADSMRRAGRDNTFCDYTKFWLRDLLGSSGVDSLNQIELSADSDPELEVVSGDAADSDDIIIYCKTVITETFALSSDTPVFWRINGVSEIVDTSVSGDVRTFSVPHVLEEEFNVSWEPEDSVMVRETMLTISTIPDVTPVGNYAFRIEISEDGDNWQEKEFLTLNADSTSAVDNVFASSGGGCDSGFSFLSVMLALALTARQKSSK